MKAVILAAGYGSRLGELTNEIPKPMIEIAGKPVLSYLIDRLNIHGISDIIIHVYRKADLIMNYFGSRVLYFYDPSLLGHLETIKALKNWLNNDFMVINGDTLTDLNYGSMIKFHKEQTITAAMDEWKCTGTWIYSTDIFLNENLPTIPYREKSQWIDIGTDKDLQKAKQIYEDNKVL